MNLAEIRTIVLKVMGVQDGFTLDENPAGEYRVMADAYVNEGYAQVALQAWKPFKAAVAELDADGAFALAELDIPDGGEALGIKDVRAVCGRCEVCAGCGRPLSATELPDGRVRVGCGTPGRKVLVTVRWMPPRLSDDSDEPLFAPEISHGMLADYALYRLMGHWEGGDLKRAEVFYASFASALGGVERHARRVGGGQYLNNKYTGV